MSTDDTVRGGSGEIAGLTWPELGERHLLLIPLGSTEQHGPHLPLDTDTRIATAVASRCVDQLPTHRRALVAPSLPFGASGEHAGFAGTLSIGTEALGSVIVELVRSLGPEFEAVVFVNGHGGNHEALKGSVDRLRSEGRKVLGWSPRLPGGDAHAGRTETSLMLALDPSAVRLNLAKAGATAPLSELMGELRAGGVRSVSENGVLGDPAGATAEEGERLLSELVRQLVTAISEASDTATTD